jgi:P27 family predicted phage terminase small subunit
MPRRKRNRLGERTGGSVRHPNSLANLRRGGGPSLAGNSYQLRHGALSKQLLADVSAEVVELMDLLAEAAPVREGDGSLPPADVVAIELAARCLKRYRHIAAYLDLHGRIADSGKVRPGAAYEVQAENQLHQALDALGMTPTSRARLGLNIARAADFDLAARWAEEPIDADADDD